MRLGTFASVFEICGFELGVLDDIKSLDAARQELSASCQATLREAADAAVRAILELLSSTSDATRLKAACYVLDRLILIGDTAPDELSESDVRKVDVQKLMAAIGV